MDVLSDILGSMRLKGTLYFSTECSRPWGIRVPQVGRVARFHLVVRGETWVRIMPDHAPILLETGDLVLIPHGAEHVLSDSPDTPCRTVDQVVEDAGFMGTGTLVFGGEDRGGPTRMVCGHFEFDDAFDHPFVGQLPPAMVVRWNESVEGSPLADIFRFITREVQEGAPGHEAVIEKLSEVLFVQAVRFWARSQNDPTGLLSAMSDPGIGAALEAIHSDLTEGWSLDALSRKAAMSRTIFAERFRALVGVTPHQYLTTWRIQNARMLLVESQISLDRIAQRVGYDSAASLSRTFKRIVGTSPAAYRRMKRASR